jgi:hypothetical protein
MKIFNCLFLLTILFGALSFVQTTIALLDLQGIGRLHLASYRVKLYIELWNYNLLYLVDENINY